MRRGLAGAALIAVAILLPGVARGALPADPEAATDPANGVPHLAAGQTCPRAEATCAIHALDYVLLTTYRQPNGRMVDRFRHITVDVPRTVDVDGDGIPELTALLKVASPTEATVQINKLPTAPARLPARIQLQGTDEGPNGPRSAYSFGYESFTDGIPSEVTVTGRLLGTPAAPHIWVDAGFAGATPGASLALLGETHKISNGAPVEPQELRTTLTPVPAKANAEIDLGAEPTVNLGVTSRTAVEARGRLVDAQGIHTIQATVRDLPQQVKVSLKDRDPQNPGTGKVLAYEASQEIGTVEAHARNLPLPQGLRDLDATVDRVPKKFTVVIPTDRKGFLFDAAGGEVGHVAASLSSGSVPPIPSPGDGVAVVAGPGRLALNARATGVRHLSVITDPTLEVNVRTSARSSFAAALRIDRAQGPPLQLDGSISRLPDSLSVRGSLGSASFPVRLTYDASDSIPLVTLGIRNLTPGTLSPVAYDPPKHLYTTIRNLPRNLFLTIPPADSANPVQIGAGLEPIGTVNFELTTGPRDFLTQDGVIVRDLLDVSQIAGRISGLRFLQLKTKPRPEFTLDSIAGNPFRARIYRQKPRDRGITYYDAQLAQVKPRTHLWLEPEPLRIHYDAEQQAGDLTFKTNVGQNDYKPFDPAHPESFNRPERVRLTAHVPRLPRVLDVCIAPSNKCSTSGMTDSFGRPRVADLSLDASASDRVNVDVFDCKEPADIPGRACEDDPSRYIWVRNVSFKVLAVELRASGIIPSGYAYANTHDFSGPSWVTADDYVSGDVYVRDGTYATVHLPTAHGSFRAMRRKVIFGGGFPTYTSGQAPCPDYTSFSVRFIDDIPLNPYICT